MTADGWGSCDPILAQEKAQGWGIPVRWAVRAAHRINIPLRLASDYYSCTQNIA